MESFVHNLKLLTLEISSSSKLWVESSSSCSASFWPFRKLSVTQNWMVLRMVGITIITITSSTSGWWEKIWNAYLIAVSIRAMRLSIKNSMIDFPMTTIINQITSCGIHLLKRGGSPYSPNISCGQHFSLLWRMFSNIDKNERFRKVPIVESTIYVKQYHCSDKGFSISK